MGDEVSPTLREPPAQHGGATSVAWPRIRLPDGGSSWTAGDIRIIALPDGLTGFWNKISLFRHDMFEPRATILYLDLDLVVVGAIDFLLDDPGGFRMIGNWRTKQAMNSSVMRFRRNRRTPTSASSNARKKIMSSGRYAGDQNWITEQIPQATFFPSRKIVSYRLDLPSHVFPLAKKVGLDFSFIKAAHFMTVAPPPDASIVVFHGKPDPEDVMDAPYGPWKRAPSSTSIGARWSRTHLLPPVARKVVPRQYPEMNVITRLKEVFGGSPAEERVYRAPPMTEAHAAAIRLIAPHFDYAPDARYHDAWEMDQNANCWREFRVLRPILDSLPKPRRILEIRPASGVRWCSSQGSSTGATPSCMHTRARDRPRETQSSGRASRVHSAEISRR